MIHKAYLSIGSNIKPAQNIRACLQKLKNAFPIRRVSSVYETSPVGPVGGEKFWNLALEIETPLSRFQMQHQLRRLESELGRVRNRNKFAPRPIDIDLVLYKNWRRAGFEKLAFVLFPLAELAPRLKPRGQPFSLGQLRRQFNRPDQKIRKRGKVFRRP